MRDYSRRDFLRQTTVTLALAALAARALPGEALADTTPDFAGFIDASGEELILGGKPLSWWIETFGLPFHVSYAPDIRANLLAFKEVFERLYPKGEVPAMPGRLPPTPPCSAWRPRPVWESTSPRPMRRAARWKRACRPGSSM
jgi:hypothetical protein